MPCCLSALIAYQPNDRIRAVLGENRMLGQRALRIKIGQFIPQFIGGLGLGEFDLVSPQRLNDAIASEHR